MSQPDIIAATPLEIAWLGKDASHRAHADLVNNLHGVPVVLDVGSLRVIFHRHFPHFWNPSTETAVFYT